jgi:tRNA threonylcarbamoyladenosine biosynthesis protein TsaB
MRVLGIESSSTVASIAIMEDERLLCEYTINETLQHSKTLMPMLEEVTRRVGIDIKTINLVAVSEGPGSFTGLRIGSATAKGIAHALKIPIASIPSLEVLAGSVMIPEALIHVIVSARASEVYYAQYSIRLIDGRFVPFCRVELESMEIEDFIEGLKLNRWSKTLETSKLGCTDGEVAHETDIARTVVLIGDAVEKFKEQLSEVTQDILRIPEHMTFSAKTVALLGIQRYYKGDVISYYEQKPNYHKKSQAEREYDEKKIHD